jgi:hypothetical protein
MSILRNKALVSKTPIITTLLLEYANVGQLLRMWTVRSALGQNLYSWIAVQIALWLWLNFYITMLPEAKFAKWATIAGITLNLAVVLTVAYFRYALGRG